MVKGSLSNRGIAYKLSFLFLIVALSSIVFTGLGMLIALLVFGVDQTLLTSISVENIAAFKLMQVFSTLGVFLIPAFLFRFLFTKKNKLFKLNSWVEPIDFLLCLLLFASLIPLTNALIKFNSQISLPDYFTQIEHWFRELQVKQEQIIEKFTLMDSPKQLLANIFVMALIPAFSEEVFFRGVLQNLILKWRKNSHLAVFVTAFFFAIIHQQFYTVIPIMFLGAILGYIYYLTNNIWIPITIHFLNNFLAVLSAYFMQQNRAFNLTEDFATAQPNTVWLLFSILISGLILVLLYKKKTNLTQ